MDERVTARPRGARSTPSARAWAIALGLYCATWFSVWATYGFFWNGGPPWASASAAIEAFTFAAGLMTIFTAHEAGHYLVARRWGVRQSLPHFIPFPMAFGTLGAIIRLRSAPPNRSALLEIGAAGPIAGFVVALVVLVLAMPDTVQIAEPTLQVPWPLPPLPAPQPPGALEAVLSTWPLSVVFPVPPADALQLVVLANPLVMDLVGILVIGAAPGRYAELSPLGMAAWAGCFLTAMNLLPIGQLDGGHVLHALSPKHASKISAAVLVLVVCAGVLWGGWLVWGLLLRVMGAHRGVVLLDGDPPRRMSIAAAAGALLSWVGCVMPQPLVPESWPIHTIRLQTEDGRVISDAEKAAWLDAGAGAATAAQPEVP